MITSQFEESTAERLRSYYPFSQEVIDAVATHAGEQYGYESYQDYLNRYGAELPNLGKRQPVLDICPADYDETKAMVIDLPMGNALDTNQQFQVANIAATNPDMRLIAFANPSGWFSYPGVKPSPVNILPMILGNFEGLAIRRQRYLDRHGVESVIEVGASYGADILASAAASGRYAIEQAIVIEPASVVHRWPHQLKNAFESTLEALDGYVKANRLEIFEDTRADAVGEIAYVAGLGRLSNLAASLGIASGNFEANMIKGQEENPDMATTIAWGGDSELALDQETEDIAWRLDAVAIRLARQKHALMNDLHLTAALILNARENPATSTDFWSGRRRSA